VVYGVLTPVLVHLFVQTSFIVADRGGGLRDLGLKIVALWNWLLVIMRLVNASGIEHILNLFLFFPE
jgi:hypothetical protein